MPPIILSGRRAGYVDKFYPADLPQQNSNQHTQSMQKRKKEKEN